MARPKSLKPAYCLHKASGRAYVKIDGRRVYLGAHGSQASRDEYDRVIGEWIARSRQSAPPPAEVAVAAITVAELVNAYRKHAADYYRRPDGTPTSEVENIRQAMRPLVRLYSRLTASEFSPLKLEALKDEMVRLGWCRSNINRHLPRVKALFK